jgi:hypothetical protein
VLTDWNFNTALLEEAKHGRIDDQDEKIRNHFTKNAENGATNGLP